MILTSLCNAAPDRALPREDCMQASRDSYYLGVWRRYGVDVRLGEGYRTKRRGPETYHFDASQGLEHHQIHL